MADGWPADQLFSGSDARSFDDLVVLPGVGDVAESAINCKTRLTRSSPPLYLPVVGGPAETVVGADMAIALALAGGVGIIHRNQSVEAQAEMVRRVKQCHNSFILNPQVLGPLKTVADVDRIKAEYGFGAIPITENGKVGGKLLGLVTSRDVENLEDRSLNVKLVMTKAEDLILAQEPVQFDAAEEQLMRDKVGKLPIVNKDMELVALICRGDILRVRQYPDAARDDTRQLLCAAAVASSSEELARCQALLDAGVDIICVDTDDGVTNATVDFVKRLKAEGNVEVLAGRVSSVRQATDLLEAGVDGLRIGSFVNAGAAEAKSVYEISRMARSKYNVPCCAEGVRDVTQMCKALCVGASSVTMNDMLSRCAEAPGDHIYRDGVRVKLQQTDDAPTKRGVVGATVDGGSARTLLPHLAVQTAKCLQDVGLATLPDVHDALDSGALRLERLRAQGKQQSTRDQHPCPVRLATSGLHNRW